MITDRENAKVYRAGLAIAPTGAVGARAGERKSYKYSD